MSIAVLPGPRMSERTTLRLGGRAAAEVRVQGEEGLERLDAVLASLGCAPAAFGRGSNVLAQDGELDMALVTVAAGAGTDAPARIAQDEHMAVVRCGAGVSLPRLLAWAAKNGLAGLENLAGVPGKVGGAVAMNAGSFGQQAGDTLYRVRLYTQGGEPQWLEREQLEMGYRHFSVKGHAGFFLVLAAEFQMSMADPEKLSVSMRETLSKKRAAQPVDAWTAGCVFKNPAPDAPAGKLLDEAGLRGFTLGGVGFSSVHANFLENHGQGTASQALELIAMAKEKVRNNSGYELELEVKLWPCN